MITIWLHGYLKDKFGEKYEGDVKSPAEAVRLLEANNPGEFYKTVREGNYHILRGNDLENGVDISEEEIVFEGSKDIHILPELTGGKGGGMQVIVGAVLVVAAVVATVVTAGAATPALMAATTGAFGITAANVAVMGAMMIIGGVAQMLTPTPEIGGLGSVGPGSSKAAQDPRKSFIFGGAENVSNQGVPVPVVYGEIETGSVIISRLLTVENI